MASWDCNVRIGRTDSQLRRLGRNGLQDRCHPQIICTQPNVLVEGQLFCWPDGDRAHVPVIAFAQRDAEAAGSFKGAAGADRIAAAIEKRAARGPLCFCMD